MANRTDPEAKSIRGTNPQNLVEKIVRSKIYQHIYWKEQCFGLTAEILVDMAMEIDHIGGTYGCNGRPTHFLCLVRKMLQIQFEKEIVIELIKNDDYNYVRVLGAFYLRLTGTDTDVYQYLERLYNDYLKVRQKLTDGQWTLETLVHWNLERVSGRRKAKKRMININLMRDSKMMTTKRSSHEMYMHLD